jgi:ElaB/YqjD/DUF883 family membrane-anchored ribosome-binding protein
LAGPALDLAQIRAAPPGYRVLVNQPTENAMKDVTVDKLMDDLRVVVGDAEELLKATAGQANEKVVAVGARAQASVDQAKVRMAALGDQVTAQSRQAAKATDEYVHHNPWQSIGVAAGLGVLLGFLIGRK